MQAGGIEVGLSQGGPPGHPPGDSLRVTASGSTRIDAAGLERHCRGRSGFAAEAVLRNVAAAKGNLFGTALPPADKLAANPDYAALLKREAAIYVADTDMQPSRIQNVEGVFTF